MLNTVQIEITGSYAGVVHLRFVWVVSVSSVSSVSVSFSARDTFAHAAFAHDISAHDNVRDVMFVPKHPHGMKLAPGTKKIYIETCYDER